MLAPKLSRIAGRVGKYKSVVTACKPSSSANRAIKLSRLRARLSFSRGCSQSRLGSGFFARATSVLQFAGGLRQALAEGAAQGDLVFVQRPLAVAAGVGAYFYSRKPTLRGRLGQALLGREVKKLPTLRGRTVVNLFFEDSTRTRISFEVAAKRLSADVVSIKSSGSAVERNEQSFGRNDVHRRTLHVDDDAHVSSSL